VLGGLLGAPEIKLLFEILGVVNDVDAIINGGQNLDLSSYGLSPSPNILPEGGGQGGDGQGGAAFLGQFNSLLARLESYDIVRELDRRVPPTGIRTLESLVDDATARVRLTLLLISVAGAAALLLGVIGVYGVVSYAANGRVREFGIRLALGAAPARVGRLVLGDGIRLVVIGTVTGLAAALGATRFLRALLYEVEPTSLAEFGVATALLVLVTVGASLIPARRAARTHPAVALRGE
jgi:ABC-type antimicrobial peptide transport system permease subunit